MLILAGVSLNAIVGENGIVTMAMKAKEQYEFAAICEELETMMFDFNVTGETGSSSLKNYMNKQVENGKIDSFKTVRKGTSMNFVIEKDGHMFYAVPDGDEYWKVVSTEEGTSELTELAIEVYTTSNVNSSGTFDLGNATKETDVVFYEKINDKLNFEIKQGTVNIYIYDDMSLTNSGMSRSAIDIYEGATLNLYLEEGAKMIVDSGLGSEGGSTVWLDDPVPDEPHGGYAGIHVPWNDLNQDGISQASEYATLNVYGDGTLIAYGGNAGVGGSFTNVGVDNSSHSVDLAGCTGGGGTGTGIGGNGGTGGVPNQGQSKGNKGTDGESAGNVTINDDITVFAYGGSGGSGGSIQYSGNGWSAGAGGGGFPGARNWSEEEQEESPEMLNQLVVVILQVSQNIVLTVYQMEE